MNTIKLEQKIRKAIDNKRLKLLDSFVSRVTRSLNIDNNLVQLFGLAKKEFYKFACLMIKDSKILYRNQANHNSVYFAGYALESYIKIILIHYGNKDFIGHLGDSDFLDKFRLLITLHPDFFTTSILKETSSDYPKKLFNGGGNSDTKASWKISSRYKIKHWSDSNFAQDIQAEIVKIETAFTKLRIDGVL